MGRALSISFAVAALMALGAGVAHATPLEANRQGSNNATEIIYDDSTAAIEVITETSAIRIPEKVRMWVNVVTDPEAAVGSRLLGTLRIHLRGDRAMSFDGIFKLVFRDSVSGQRTRMETTDSFVLRPRPGRRSHRIDYSFDMPSGTYLYFGVYKPASV